MLSLRNFDFVLGEYNSKGGGTRICRKMINLKNLVEISTFYQENITEKEVVRKFIEKY